MAVGWQGDDHRIPARRLSSSGLPPGRGAVALAQDVLCGVMAGHESGAAAVRVHMRVPKVSASLTVPQSVRVALDYWLVSQS